MKLNYSLLLLLSACALGTVALMDRPQPTGLVVHEWGTFTSFQGGDGNLLNWKPLVTSALPDFVYNWQHPGLGRLHYNAPTQMPTGQYLFTKGSMVTLQRMETPVVYFYSDKALTADLSVQFPQGLITEWFPQARQIGRSFVPPSKSLTGLDAFVHKCGVTPRLSLASTLTAKPVSNSVIHWSDIHVLPRDSTASAWLPTDTSGTHYFAARETDANLLRLDSLSSTNPAAQYEKFLFYRGAGSFATPLRITMKSDNAVTLANTGKEPLAHLFVLDVKDKSGGFIYVAQLLPGEEKTVLRAVRDQFLSPAILTDKLSSEMSQALVKEGLYPREASAMVKTWKSSWFTEDGTRVLYILPRAWTDQTLPMSLTPVPRELTRVMVGRAEVLTPGFEQNLALLLDKADRGDSAVVAELHQTASSLGRFAEPAFNRVFAKINQPADYAKLSRIFFNQTGSSFE